MPYFSYSNSFVRFGTQFTGHCVNKCCADAHIIRFHSFQFSGDRVRLPRRVLLHSSYRESSSNIGLYSVRCKTKRFLSSCTGAILKEVLHLWSLQNLCGRRLRRKTLIKTSISKIVTKVFVTGFSKWFARFPFQVVVLCLGW